ncbi:hypothetical protein CLOP_g23631, partial [Closterium sp. NIES-67]
TCHVDASVPEVLVGDYLRLRKVVDSIVGEPATAKFAVSIEC